MDIKNVQMMDIKAIEPKDIVQIEIQKRPEMTNEMRVLYVHINGITVLRCLCTEKMELMGAGLVNK